jgi:cobalt-zinc-cadmium efflux system protein
MTGDHQHGTAELAKGDRSRLKLAVVALATFLVVETVFAVIGHSMALLSDAGHMLTDLASLVLALWVASIQERPPTTTWSFGLHRAEVISGALNGIALITLATLIITDDVIRILHPHAVDGAVVIGVSLGGIFINVIVTVLLSHTDRTSLNLAGAFAHILTDLWAFGATLIAGIVIEVFSFNDADLIASLIVVVLMLRAALSLLKQSGRILLEGTPPEIDLETIREHLLAESHVQQVHDLHAWVVATGLTSISAHIVLDEACFQSGHASETLDLLQSCLAQHFNLTHSTLQLETPPHIDHEEPGHE